MNHVKFSQMYNRKVPIECVPLDVLYEILSSLDKQSLYRCTLVCHIFREAATPSLYREITIDGIPGDELEDLGSEQTNTSFQTVECNDSLHRHVRRVSQCFYLEQDAPLADIPVSWLVCISKLVNLRAYSITTKDVRNRSWPKIHLDGHLAHLIYDTLSQLNSFEELNLDFDILPTHVPTQFRPGAIRKLHAGGEQIQVVGALASSFTSLVSLGCKEDVISPELGALQPSVIQRLEHLTLEPGGGFSLQSLSEFTNLKTLDIFGPPNDHQYGEDLDDKPFWEFSKLTHLTLRYHHEGEADMVYVEDWVHHLISNSPIQSFTLLDSCYEYWCRVASGGIHKLFGPNVTFINTPRIAPNAKELRMILANCPKLEAFSFYLFDIKQLDIETLDTPSRLAVLQIRTQHPFGVASTAIQKFVFRLKNSYEQFRRIRVTSEEDWVGLWTSHFNTGHPAIDILLKENMMPPYQKALHPDKPPDRSPHVDQELTEVDQEFEETDQESNESDGSDGSAQ